LADRSRPPEILRFRKLPKVIGIATEESEDQREDLHPSRVHLVLTSSLGGVTDQGLIVVHAYPARLRIGLHPQPFGPVTGQGLVVV
jgi:hypothetical protein